MFYLKKNIGSDIEVNIDIFEDEFFTKCGECGKEMPVEVDELIHVLEEGDLAGTCIYCDDCAKKKFPKDGQLPTIKESSNLPTSPTREGILSEIDFFKECLALPLSNLLAKRVLEAKIAALEWSVGIEGPRRPVC